MMCYVLLLLLRIYLSSECNSKKAGTASAPHTATTTATTTKATTTTKTRATSRVLLAEEGAAEHMGGYLGIYDLTSDRVNGEAAYQQRGGEGYIYKATSGSWYVGPELGGSTLYLYTKDLASTGAGWKYYDGTAWQNDDDTIKLIHINNPLAACLECQQVRIDSSGNARSKVPQALGVFTKTGDFSSGRPTFVNSENNYLMLRTGNTAFSVWSEISGGTVYLRSASGPICATDTKAGHSDRYKRSGWQFNDGGVWAEDTTLKITCLD